MDQTFEFVKVFLDKLAKMNHAWETWGAEGATGATFANVGEELKGNTSEGIEKLRRS